MDKHNTSTELADARARLRIAEENCPHWDYDEMDPRGPPCCEELHAATEAVMRLRAKIRRAPGPA